MVRARRFLPGLFWMITAVVGLAAAGQKAVDLNDPLTLPRITLDAFRPLQASGAVLVVDVRDELAFQGGHIPGAMSVPLSQVERRVRDIKKKAGRRPIVAYCSCPSEHSAAEAGLVLYAHDVKDVRALVGGYIEWVRSGGAIER